MSGWIKLEKDLLTDPRVIRMARQLCNGSPLQGVTLVLGALAHLWMIADTHIGDDDVLPLGVDEINEVIGLEQFAQSVPLEWLQVIDSERVKLPEFHTHNGGTAKKNAMNALRVTKHRKSSNAKALPDKDKDIDKDIQERGAIFDPQSVPGLDVKAWLEWVEYRAQRKPAIKPASMAAAARELANFGEKQSQAVQHSKANGYQGLFLPKAAAFVKPPPIATVDPSTEWASLNARAQAMNPPFRRPDIPRETAAGYATALMVEEMRRHGSQANGGAHA